MRIKKYVADSVPEVLKLVKNDLGPKAVVLNTRTLGKTGILGKKGQVEVTAAIDGSGRTAARTGKKPARQAPEATAAAQPARQQAPRPRPATATQAPSPAPVARATTADPNALARISAQLNELQARIGGSGAGVPAGVLPETLGKLASQMEQDDLDRSLASHVVKKLLTDPGAEGYKAAGPLKKRAAALLADRMGPTKETIVTGKIRSVIALVGTSGAGKTTAAAKLAAHFAGQDKSIALISTDTDRVGGLEQIRAYGRILDLPVETAYTADEMREAMQKHKDKDLVIVDTGGISPEDENQKESLKDALREAAPNEIHLVISAPTGLRQMRDAVDGLKEVGVDRLLFTRMDETTRYGAACSIAIETGISASYVTNSRVVPGDLCAAESLTLPKALFVRSLNGTAES